MRKHLHTGVLPVNAPLIGEGLKVIDDLKLNMVSLVSLDLKIRGSYFKAGSFFITPTTEKTKTHAQNSS